MYKDIRIKHEGAYSRYTDVVLVCGDYNAYRIIYTLPEGETAIAFKVTCTRADGKIVTDLGEVSGRECVYVMATDMYAVEGGITVRLAVEGEAGSCLTVCELCAEVAAGTGNGAEAENLTPVLNKVLENQYELEESFKSHKEAEVLDHPDGSVTAEKLADNSVTGDKMSEDVKDKLIGVHILEKNQNKDDIPIFEKSGVYLIKQVSPIPNENRDFFLFQYQIMPESYGQIMFGTDYGKTGIYTRDAKDGVYEWVFHNIVPYNGTEPIFGMFQPSEHDYFSAEAGNSVLKRLTDHKYSSVLDHSDGSVTTEKLADGAVTEEKLDNALIAHLNDYVKSTIAPTVIKNTAEGADISIRDSYEAPLSGMRVFGKTAQGANPSPANPQPLESVGDKGNIEVSIQGENPDDTAQTLTLSTPNGLPGIPVSVGGNHTDENGQRRVCDTIDLARGKYVQRIWTRVLNGSEKWSTYNSSSGFMANVLPESMTTRDGFSDQLRIVKSSADAVKDSASFGVGNSFFYVVKSSFYDANISDKGLSNWKAHLSEHPITIMTYRVNPVEIDLTDAEVAAYTALHTNSPVTNIANDEGAYMEVVYTADTKSYIDKSADDAAAAIIGSISPEQHAAIFRGKNLGSMVTDEQKAAIRDGSFKDLFLGDYWVINNVTWRIVDMDYWYNTYTTDSEYFCSHHLVIMPDTCLAHAMMNDDGTTTGGYVGSDMYKTGLTSAKTMITNAFGDLVLTHGEYLVNAVTNDTPSGAALKDSTVEIPSEIMMYGTNIYSHGSDGAIIPVLHTYCKTQLALFDAAPRYIADERGNYYWLRDVVESGIFAVVTGHGSADWSSSDNNHGVRPYFCIG